MFGAPHRSAMTAARIPREPPAVGAERCPACGAAVETPYCSSCGEQRASDRHYSLQHLGEELFETLFHADGRAIRTIRTLIARPGALTAAYMRGERKPYVAPLQLFFLANVVFFVWVGITHVNTFSTPLRFHVGGMFYSGLAHRMVDARLAARHVTYESYAAIFDHAATLQAKSLIILMVPMLAVVTMLLTLPERRATTQHVVFALHTMTAVLLLVMAVSLALGLIAGGFAHAGFVTRWQLWDQLSALLILIALGAYTHRALRRAYGLSSAGAAARAIAFALAFIPTVILYRAVLFFTTFYTT